jgi:hypothetical protein
MPHGVTIVRLAVSLAPLLTAPAQAPFNYTFLPCPYSALAVAFIGSPLAGSSTFLDIPLHDLQ